MKMVRSKRRVKMSDLQFDSLTLSVQKSKMGLSSESLSDVLIPTKPYASETGEAGPQPDVCSP